MTDHVATLIVGGFSKAEEAEAVFKQLKDHPEVRVQDAALVERTADGELKMHDAKDWGWGKGALVGGLAGLIVGVIMPPAGVILGLLSGAGVGAASAGLHDAGIQTKTLQALAATLDSGTAALILAVDPDGAKAAEDFLTQAGAATVTEGLTGEALEKLKAQQGPTKYESSMLERGVMDEAKYQ